MSVVKFHKFKRQNSDFDLSRWTYHKAEIQPIYLKCDFFFECPRKSAQHRICEQFRFRTKDLDCFDLKWAENTKSKIVEDTAFFNCILWFNCCSESKAQIFLLLCFLLELFLTFIFFHLFLAKDVSTFVIFQTCHSLHAHFILDFDINFVEDEKTQTSTLLPCEQQLLFVAVLVTWIRKFFQATLQCHDCSSTNL